MDNTYEVVVTATLKAFVRAGSKQSASRQVKQALDDGIISFAEDGDTRLDFTLLQGSEPVRKQRTDRGAFATGVMPEIPIAVSREPAAPPAEEKR